MSASVDMIHLAPPPPTWSAPAPRPDEHAPRRYESCSPSERSPGSKLVAVEFVRKCATNGDSFWRWRCDCGGEIVARVSHVRRNATSSCGCINKYRKHRTGTGTRTLANSLPTGHASAMAHDDQRALRAAQDAELLTRLSLR